MEDSYFSIKDISAYCIASELSDRIWDNVSEWDYFNKNTVGTQFVKSVDSVAANIAEGFGRHFKKEKIRFYYYARGSVVESIHWCDKAYLRALISKKESDFIKGELDKLPKEINTLIKITTSLKI